MTSNPYLKIDQQMVGDTYTAPDVMDNLAILCDDFGSRFAGTAGERQAAEFIEETLVAYGVQHVRLEPVEYVGWTRGTATLEIISPIHKQIPCITLPHSPPTDLAATIVDVGDGGPDAFARAQSKIAGKIAMVNSKTQPRGAQRWIHRGEKYGRRILAGATGFIFVNHYPGYGPATGGIGHNGAGLIPGISINYEDGAFIQRLIERKGEVQIRLKSTDRCAPMVSWNIIGDLPGTAAKAQTVMLGCHYDGHDISQGAVDPASGVVAVLEAARLLAKHAGQMPHTLRFALWGIEEIGLLGSGAYVEAHRDELDDIRFYFNMDSAGGGQAKDVVLNEWPQLEALFGQWQREMALDFAVGQSVNAFSDHFAFLLAGVPTGGMEPVERDLSGRGYGHTHYDTLDKVHIRNLREASALAARLGLRLAHGTDWPVARRNQQAVEALFAKPAYQEQRAITTQINDYVAKHQSQQG